MKMTRYEFDKLARWFKAGLRDAVEKNPRPITPSNPDIQGDPGPRPYSDWAYERGRILGEMILADERSGI